jgi:sec-independent protein translocase protein TatB
VFNLQGSEIVVILLLALVVLGPEKLPDAIRRFTRTYGELKKMGSGFQTELKSALDEPMSEIRKTGDLIRDAADPSRYVDNASTPDPTAGEPAAAGMAAAAGTAAAAAESLPLTVDADPSDPGSEIVATAGDPPTPSSPPTNLVEARRDGKLTPVADHGEEGVDDEGVDDTDQTATA